MTTWFLEGVGQMTMFDHEGGGGVKISEKSDHVVYGWPLISYKTSVQKYILLVHLGNVNVH